MDTDVIGSGVEHSFLFADLVGFTAFTERCGDEPAADLALDFLDGARAIAAEHGCEVVKSLGDAVLIHGHDPARVLAVALRLSGEADRGTWRLPVRIGVHTGTAVQRGDDWYGAAVNVASRMADAAHPGEVLLSEVTRSRMPDRGGPRMAECGARTFKNVAAPLSVYAAAVVAVGLGR